MQVSRSRIGVSPLGVLGIKKQAQLVFTGLLLTRIPALLNLLLSLIMIAGLMRQVLLAH